MKQFQLNLISMHGLRLKGIYLVNTNLGPMRIILCYNCINDVILTLKMKNWWVLFLI